MLRSTLINKTMHNLEKLPIEKVEEVSDYIEFVVKKHEESVLQKGIEALASSSKAYKFLDDEEDLYTVSDLKEKYNGKG